MKKSPSFKTAKLANFDSSLWLTLKNVLVSCRRHIEIRKSVRRPYCFKFENNYLSIEKIMEEKSRPTKVERKIGNKKNWEKNRNQENLEKKSRTGKI